MGGGIPQFQVAHWMAGYKEIQKLLKKYLVGLVKYKA